MRQALPEMFNPLTRSQTLALFIYAPFVASFHEAFQIRPSQKQTISCFIPVINVTLEHSYWIINSSSRNMLDYLIKECDIILSVKCQTKKSDTHTKKS